MRFVFLAILPAVLISCQLNHSNKQIQTLDFTGAAPAKLPALAERIDKEIKVARYRQREYQVKLELITHSQFVFLEFADLAEDEISALPDITSESEYLSTAVSVFDLTKHPYFGKYEKYIGRTISVFDASKTNHHPTIKKIVLVKDPEMKSPYVALTLNLPEDQRLNDAFATSNKRMNPYPFVQTEAPEIAQTALAYFDSLSEFHRVKTEMKATGERSDKYVWVFDVRPNEKFVFVQNQFIGDCEQMTTSYAALYHVTRDNWIQECEGEVLYYFRDMIDLDGDKYPELLMGTFAGTAIFEITNRGFTQKRAMSWASDECAC